MKYVFDASVGLKAVLPEIDSDKAILLIEDFQNQVHELIAPDTYLVECAHALTRAERRGLIQSSDSRLKFSLISDTCPVLISHIPLLARAIELSSMTRHGVYDCLYVALAESEKCELVTADKRLIPTLGIQFPIISLDSM